MYVCIYVCVCVCVCVCIYIQQVKLCADLRLSTLHANKNIQSTHMRLRVVSRRCTLRERESL